jgi:ABC-2 type transport system permease protein
VNGLAGTGTMIRLILRRDRIRIPVWIFAIVGIILSSAASVIGVYATQAEIDAYASSVGGNPAVIAMNGPAYALDTIGGVVVYETSLIGVVGIALMSLLLVTRHTRTEEETGRAELIQAGVVGRHARLTATLVVVTAVNLLLGVVLSAGLASLDLPVQGSLAFGFSMACLGLVFAGLAAVASQITEYGRAAAALTGAIFGAAYVLRAAGDVGSGFLSWFSPIGWAQAVQAYGDERWWTLLLLLGLAILLVVAAVVLESRRDLGGGLIPSRPGPPDASDALSGPLGLAARLQRAGMLGWAAGIFLLGLAYGSMSRSIEELVESNPELEEVLLQQDASLTESFLATAMLTTALIVAGCAIQSMLRLRSEENAGRVESLLATALSRDRWAGGHVTVALGGSLLVVLLGGLGTGLSHSLVVGDWGELPRIVGAALVNVPAVWVLAAIALLLFGLIPRLVAVSWAILALCLIVGILGTSLNLPEWMMNLSPFQHTPALPAEDLTIAPLLIMGALAAVLIFIGFASFRRRDLTLN